MKKLDNELWVEAAYHIDEALMRIMEIKDRECEVISRVLYTTLNFMEERPGIKWPHLKEVSNG